MPTRSPNSDTNPFGRGGNRPPELDLVPAVDPAPEVEAEALLGSPAEAQLGERNAELCDPSSRIAGHGHVPDRLPRSIVLGVVVEHPVTAHAGGVHHELERGAAVVVGVDQNADPVRGRILVPPGERRGDLLRPGIVGPDPDVKRVVGVDHPELGRLAGRPALVGLPLEEFGHYGRGRPGPVVQASVEPRWMGLGPHRHHLRAVVAGRIGAGRLIRRSGQEQTEQVGPDHRPRLRLRMPAMGAR